MRTPSTRDQKGKQPIISISDDESEPESYDDDDDDGEEEEDSSGEDDAEEDDDPSSEDNSGSEADYDDDDEDDDDEEEDGGDGPPEGKPTDEEIYNKVVDLLRRRRSLNTLKLEECKAYLRMHHLRLSGTKATCIERIQEHWRIKDGNAEKLYPAASFVVNCTGDVCKGDVILFKQRVYEKFDKVTRGGGGNIIGKRIIAGRVVKESYGAAKQQHTFTVEILWSKGVKPLPPLYSLLVKGRNLYRMKTFRQRWRNETERFKVLAEKHKRGAAARSIRAIAKARSSNIGSKRHRNSSTRAPPNKRRKKDPEPSTRRKKQSSQHSKASSTVHVKRKQITQLRLPESPASHPEHNTYRENGVHTQAPFPESIHSHNQYYTRMDLHRRNDIAASNSNRPMFYSSNYDASYSSAAIGPLHHHPLQRGNYMYHPYANPTPRFDPRYPGHTSREGYFNTGPYFR